MSIASRITSIEEHIGDIYDTLELGGADLTNVDKNLINISPKLRQKLIDYMNNGTQEIWNNWGKVTGTGKQVTLNNTIHAPMNLGIKGDSEQVQYSGKNRYNKADTSIVSGGVQTSESEITTGKRITALTASGASSQYAFKLYKLIDLTNYVGKVVRMKANFSKSANTLTPIYRIGLCASNGTNRNSKAQTTTSGDEISFTVPTLDTDAKYLAVWLYLSLDTNIAIGDYVDFTNIIVTIDNSDMSFEPYCGRNSLT